MQGNRSPSLWKILSLVIATGWVGCGGDVSRWRLQDTRMTDQTAHVLPEGRLEVGAGLVGTRVENLGVSLPVRYGAGAGVEVSANVAHLALGVVNAQAEWEFHESPNGSFSLRAGVLWLNPEFFWWASDEQREALGDAVEVLLVPVELLTTLPVSSGVDATLSVGYTHAAAIGGLSDDSSHATGQFGTRDLVVGGQFTFVVTPKVALNLGAQVPVWAASHVNASGETEIAPGVVVGVVTDELIEHDISGLYTVEFSAIVLRDDLWLRIGLVQNYRFITGTIPFPIPTIDMAWRF